jgi:hypothetical protein
MKQVPDHYRVVLRHAAPGDDQHAVIGVYAGLARPLGDDVKDFLRIGESHGYDLDIGLIGWRCPLQRSTTGLDRRFSNG